MFNFFKNKTKIDKDINISNIKNYNEAIKAIKKLIADKNWEKSNEILNIIWKKELDSYTNLVNNKDITPEKTLVLAKQYEKKEKEIKKIKEEIKNKQDPDKKIKVAKKTLSQNKAKHNNTNTESKNSILNFLNKFFWNNEIKKIETSNIRNYNEALKTIKFFIATYDWEKAKKSLDEISEKELSSYKNLIEKIEDIPENDLILKEKTKITIKYRKKQKELEILKEKYRKEKNKYDIKIEKQRFEIRFKNIKEETNHLARSWKANWALKLLWKFLEENPWNRFVINFYNTEKKYILKQIEREKEIEEEKLKQNTQIEALKLIGETVNIDILEEGEKSNRKWEKKVNFFDKIKEKLNFYKKIREKLERKRLLDEINLLIEEENKVKNEIASVKLENIHKWLIKDISKENLIWYNLYGKILWAHKISGDTFWFNEVKKKYTFFIWDATWHWIKAWFIITLLTRLFNQFVEKSNLKDLIYEINNWLKQDLKSMNFITWIFFEIFKENPNKVNFVWLWHEPILIYRKESKKIEKIIPGWLAAWIRIIKNANDIKVSEINMWESDILLTYSDWIIESKSLEWEFYSLNRLIETFEKIANYESDIKKIYDYIIKDAKHFRGWANFDDDLTLLLFKRDLNKDKIDDKEEFLRQIWEINTVSKTEIKKLKWITRKEIQEELEKIKEEKHMQSIIRQLEQLWLTWEILKLKSEARRYIKEGYIHTKINYYLKKAIDNQQKYKISLKEDRIKNKYNLMKEILKKWDYSTVIREAEDIISKDWNI